MKAEGAQVVQFMRHFYVVFLCICQIRKSVVDTFVSAAAAVSAIYYFSSMKQCKGKMAKSPFTFLRAAAAAEPKIKDNILHHLSLCSLIEREGNLFDLWLCFPSLHLSLFLSCPYSCCRCCCCCCFDLL